jgi:DNA polymerase-3 subunit delta'
MSAMQALPWQGEIWSRLAHTRAQNQLAHAWLVSGPHGVGKRPLIAAWVAAMLCGQPNAEGFACGVCGSCKMLLSGGHPDAHLLTLDGHLGLAFNPSLQREDGITHWQPEKSSKRKEIAVDGTRSLIDALHVASHRQGNKIAVIAPAEDLNRSAADALLKTIEEPTPNTYLILIADQAQSLSPTLRSRCRPLRLGVPPALIVLDWLKSQVPESSAEACSTALSLARGAPFIALEQLQQGEVSPAIGWRAALDEIALGRGDPMKLAAAVDDETVTAFLHCCQVWLVDFLRKQVIDGVQISGRKVAQLNNELHDAHRRLDANARAQLVLEAMLIGWLRLLAPAPRSSPQSVIMQNRLA